MRTWNLPVVNRMHYPLSYPPPPSICTTAMKRPEHCCSLRYSNRKYNTVSHSHSKSSSSGRME